MAAVTTRRETRAIEFRPPDVEPVADALAMISEVGDGWINLMPGIPEDSPDVTPPSGLFAFFGTRQAPVTMATVMPPKRERAATEGLSVGLMHPTGSKAIARLAEAGVALPGGWVVRQDHARRGIVLRAAVGAAPADVITWCVRAGTELCRADMTGEWRAVVYLP
jgi:hypothetical protein